VEGKPLPTKLRPVPTDDLLQRQTTVGFLELAHVHEGLKAQLLADIADLIDSNAYTNGPAVSAFEEAFAAYCGTRHCVGLASGLDALRLALLAWEIGPGDEVIVPANTFVATVEAVSQAGAVPVLVDVNEDDYNLDIDAVTAAVGERTRAIVPVHLYGQVADVVGIRELARKSDVRVLEDAAQAHGARRAGARAGTIGNAAAFSFYPGKNLGAMGDAGALVTDDTDLDEVVRALREHGQRRKYHHDLPGYTARLDTIQALVLLRKLDHLDAWNEERRAAARYYSEALAGVGDLRLPTVPDGSEPVWHLFVVRTASPDSLAAFLHERRIGSGRHYPEPVHLTRAYAHLGYDGGSFPVSERLAAEVLSLPIFPGITEVQLEGVVNAVTAYFDG
jgi:dTDP-3-amino-3,4,6-trideoxy-alpha-D-glucose transaminase